MRTKQSKAALIRLIESGIREVGDIPGRKLYVLVRDVEVRGSPPTHIVASVLVRFLPSRAPFCCGEPVCHSHVFTERGTEELGEFLRRKMNQSITIELVCSVEYFEGIRFTALH